MTIRIAYFGAKDIGADSYQCLESRLVEFDAEIVGVFTNRRGSRLRRLAEKNDIPVYDDMDALAEVGEVDFLFSVQYDRLLKNRHLELVRQWAVNLHLAPLPEYRGCNQFSFAIINGASKFGVTLHLMVEGMDAGPIVAERRFAIPEDLWVDQLVERANAEGLNLFRDVLGDLLHQSLSPIDQALLEAERGTSTHFRSEIQDLKCIDLAWPLEKIERHLRATMMPGFEPPYALVGERKIFMLADLDKSDPKSH